MFSQQTLDFVSKLHKSNLRACLITAGAGSTAISALMSVPGCSKTLLDAQVPYSVASTIELLDNYPQQYVSSSVAANLSHTAFARAQKLAACPCNPPNVLHGHVPTNTSRNDNTSILRNFVPIESHATAGAIQGNIRIVGLGATAAISTFPDRRGDDRVHACCRTEEGVYFRSLTMTKGLPRHVQEWMVSCVLLQLLADVSDMIIEPDSNTVVKDLCLSMVTEGEVALRETIAKDLSSSLVKTHMPLGPNPFSLLLDGKIQKLLFNRYGVPHFDGSREGIMSEHSKFYENGDDGEIPGTTNMNRIDNNSNSNNSDSNCNSGPQKNIPPLPPRQLLPFDDEPSETAKAGGVHHLLYPGSFNPLHHGHTILAHVAQNLVYRLKSDGKPVVLTYEVATSRVDKRSLRTPTDLAAVASQFLGSRVVFSSAMLFIDKAKMFPNHGFVVGVDTAVRILDTKYYDNSKDKMIAALREIEKLNCYFIVAGRKYGTSGWTGMHEVETPAEVSHLFVPIPEADFRVDISSTELRERQAAASGPGSPSSATAPLQGSVSGGVSPFFPQSPSSTSPSRETEKKEMKSQTVCGSGGGSSEVTERGASWTS